MEGKKMNLSFATFFILSIIALLSIGNGANAQPSDVDDGSKDADLIAKLPNQPAGVNFRQYAGYITIDPATNKKFFYYLAESSTPSSMPLILWLSSGPGKSALGYGAFMQVGPFRVEKDGKTLIRNPNALNTAANILFVDMPAGVGFSTPGNASEDASQLNDAKVVADLFTFVKRWFLRFEEYKDRELYIAAQGYAAGHFVPQLANRILDYDKKMERNAINIMGVMMGNPPLDATIDVQGRFHFYWSHGLISDDTYEGFQNNCNPGDPNGSLACAPYYEILANSAANLNKDNFHSPMCPVANISEINEDNFHSMVFGCNEQYIAGYLNSPSVQNSLHIDVKTGNQIWVPYNSEIEKNWEHIEPQSRLDQIRTLIGNGLEALLYSGDMDLTNPMWGTQLALEKLNLTVREEWRPWYSTHVEVGGYATVYSDGVTYAMVRNVGVYAGQYEGQRIGALIQSFISPKSPPKSIYFPFESTHS